MFPFQKIFTLLIRTFSRPLLGYAKRRQIEKPGSKLAGFFIGLGRKSQLVEYWINHRILKTAKNRHMAELKEELLLEKGIETFYEILFYLIVLGLPFYELYKSSISAQKKQEALQRKISSLEKKMESINSNIGKILEYSKARNKESKERAKNQVAQYEQIIGLKQKKKLNLRMNIMTETTQSKESDSLTQKIEEMFQNAIEVVADQFEDSLDELEFPNGVDATTGSVEVSINDPATADSQIESIEVDGEQGSTDLQQGITLDDTSVQVSVDDAVDVQVDVDDAPSISE